MPVHTSRRTGKSPQRFRSAQSSRSLRLACLEVLEDRAVPAVLLDIDAAGVLTYTEQNTGVVNNLTVSTSGPAGVESFADTGSPITLGPGATADGFSVSGNTASGPATAIQSIRINTNDGADVLSVSFAGANPIPSGGLTYLGNGAAALNLTGPAGAVSSEVYTATGPGAGTITFGGSSALTFSGLQPINDTVPATNYTFTAPAGSGQNVRFGTGPVVAGTQTATISDASGATPPAFELANIANKTNVTLSVGEGSTIDQQVSLSDTVAPAGLAALTVRTGGGNDLVNVTASTPGVATSVFTGSGNDVVNVTASTLGAEGSLTLNGGPGAADVLNVDAKGQNSANTSTPGVITFAPGGGTISYSEFESVNVTNTNDQPLTGTPAMFAASTGQTLNNVVVASFTDADPNAKAGDFVATVDFKDGTAPAAGTVVANGTGSFSVQASHTFATSGTFSPVVTVTDKGSTGTRSAGGVTFTSSDTGGQTTTITSTATVTDSPIAASSAPAITGVVEGKPLVNVLVATFTDTDTTAPAAAFSATIDWGDGSPRSSGLITKTGTGFEVRGNHTYAQATAATLPVIVTIEDSSGRQANTVTSVNGVADAPLTNAVAEPVTAVEGTAATDVPVARFTDTNPLATVSMLTATVNFGNGVTAPGTVVLVGGTSAGALFEVRASHLFAAAGTFPVGVTVTDTGGQTISLTGATGGQATVAAAAVTATGLTLTGEEGRPLSATTLPSGQTNVLVASFTSANPGAVASDFSAVINWGDGTTTPATAIQTFGSANGQTFLVFGDHTYAESGTYATTVTVASASGARAVAAGQAVIADAPLSEVTPEPDVVVTEGRPFTAAVASFNDANPNAPLSDFRATIDWGDGTAPSAGFIVPSGGPGSAFLVGGTHTYADSGVNGGNGRFAITVNVEDVGGARLNVANVAVVQDVPIAVEARLSPASDSGVSNTDGITNVAQPTFVGTSEPSSTIRLFVTTSGTSSPVLVGQGATDAAGRFSIPSDLRFPDGRYVVQVQATDAAGHTTAVATATTGQAGGVLTIDTVGPKVQDVLFGRLSGQVLVTLQDERSGLDQISLIDGQNYTLTKRNVTGQGRYLVTQLVASPQGQPDAPQGVLVTFNTGNSLRGGAYTFTIRSGGIRDVAGNALDGEFFGTFPSGNNIPGGDFVTQLNAIHRRVSAPGSVIGPANPTGFGRLPGTVTIGGGANGQAAAATRAAARAAATTRAAATRAARVAHVAEVRAVKLAAHDAALAHIKVAKPRHK